MPSSPNVWRLSPEAAEAMRSIKLKFDAVEPANANAATLNPETNPESYPETDTETPMLNADQTPAARESSSCSG